MRKKVADTLQQRLGFMDPDLKDPEHDQIVIWVRNQAPAMLSQWLGHTNRWPPQATQESTRATREAHEQCLRVLDAEIEKQERRAEDGQTESALFRSSSTFREERIRQENERLARLKVKREQLLAIDLQDDGGQPEVAVTHIEMEHLIADASYRGGKYPIGYVDLLVAYKIPHPALSLGDLHPEHFDTWMSSNSVDPPIPPTHVQWKARHAYFEAKTRIPSLGELLRQINLYKNYLKPGEWFVVSPDIKYREILAEEGIRFIVYKP